MAAKIKKGDNVIVLIGRDKGKKGSVVRIDTLRDRALVQGVNMMKRHRAPGAGDPGGIKEMEAPIALSNLAIEDPKDGRPTRVGFKKLEDGRKVRYAKRSGEVIDR
ncbi:MAG: 50S ribosomal protein L24 [Proteobacteria bacterium]|jgi:large subunit ribosomal protein L24|nr:50S ribosomal protein L24 [Pseudomonadota bacterium]MDA1059543.1 50S ribosomal protein L24 [Pseudomonadota bacterium]